MLIPVSDLNLGFRVYIAGITLDFRKKKRRKLYCLLLSFLGFSEPSTPFFPSSKESERSESMESSITLDNSRWEERPSPVVLEIN